MSYSKDELQAPDWINGDFFKLVLENIEKCTNIKINDYQITPATMAGDHVATIMFRAKIQYSTNEKPNGNITIIIKTAPVQEGFKKDLLAGLDIFETEIFMYSKVLPICADTIKMAGIKELLAPKVLYHELEPHKVIVFEDLKELDYFMYPTTVPSNDVFKLIFGKLAQLHAGTFKMGAEGNTEITKLKGTLFSIPNIKEMDAFASGLKNFIEFIEQMPEFACVAEKVRHVKQDVLLDKCIESLSIPGSYNVLNHGDFHINNMMFQNGKDGNISDVIFLDFQMCHWGSPAHDLTIMGYIVPYEKRDEMYKHYFSTFIDVLQKSGYNGILPTYEQLQDEMLKLRHVDFLYTTSFLQFVGMEKGKDFDPEELMAGKDSRLFLYKSKKYIKAIRELLPIYLENGYFDTIKI